MPIPDETQADLDELLASLDLLSEDDAWFLAEQWEREDADARKEAWAKAKSAIEQRGLTKELDRLRGSIGSWMQVNRSDLDLQGMLGLGNSGSGARQSAAPALMDATAALLAGDALSEEEAAVLLRPWQALGEDDEPND